MKRSAISTFLCLMIGTLFAQDVKSHLDALNARFGGSVKLRLDKEERLVMDLFDASGHIRQDQVYIEYLDANGASYSAEENAVVLACKMDRAGCIEKEVFKMNVIRHTNRSSLPAPAGDANGAATIADFNALVGLMHEQQQKRNDETHARPQRRR